MKSSVSAKLMVLIDLQADVAHRQAKINQPTSCQCRRGLQLVKTSQDFEDLVLNRKKAKEKL